MVLLDINRASVLHQLRTNNMVISFVIFTLVGLTSSFAIGALNYDKEEVYSAIRYKSREVVSTWEFNSTTTNTIFRNAVTEDQITRDYISKFNKDPEMDNAHFQDYRLGRIDMSGVTIHQTAENWLIDPKQGIRLETTITRREKDGKPDLRMAGRSQIEVLNSDYRRILMPKNNAGFVHPGMTGNKLSYYDLQGEPYLTTAGMPFAQGPCVLDNMKSIEEVSTPEGDGIKVVFSQDFGKGVGNVFVMWLLPDKGYTLQRSEQYMHGKLLFTKTFSQIEEIQPGMWYPMKQLALFPVRPTLPDDIEDMLRNGEIALHDNRVLMSQQYTEYKTRERNIESVFPDKVIKADKFVLEFPLGTTLHIFEKDTDSPLVFSYDSNNDIFDESIEGLPESPVIVADKSTNRDVSQKTGNSVRVLEKATASVKKWIASVAVAISLLLIICVAVWKRSKSIS